MRRLVASLSFAVISAVQNFVRNLWLSVAGVVTMTLILVVVGAILAGTHSVGSLVDQQKTHASKLQIYLQDTASEASIANFQLHLASDPRVVSVGFTSKDMALQQARDRGLDPDAQVQVIGANPLPQSIDVTTKQLNDVSAIANAVQANPLVDQTGHSTDNNVKVQQSLISFSSQVTVIGIGLSLMFGFISLVIIMVTIRTAVFVRRAEIEIMKLVGATDWFVCWPFILEGILGGLIAAGFSTVMLYAGYGLFISNLHSTILSVPYDGGYLTLLLGLVVAVGVALGGFGSYLGMRRFLSV